MTRPIFVKPCTPALLEVRNGSHPCIMNTHNGGEYIPNDVLIEGQRSCLLVTGPNMGGKSTLMRQTGLLVVLAQLVVPYVYVTYRIRVGVMYSGVLCSSFKVQVKSSG